MGIIERLALEYLEWHKRRYLSRVGVRDPDLPVHLMDNYQRTYGSNPLLLKRLVAEVLSVGVKDLAPMLTEAKQYKLYKERIDAKLQVFEDKPYQLGAIDLEIDAIVAILSQLHEVEVLEIGVANGYSSAFLYYVIDRIGGRITSVDLPRFAKPPRLPRDILRHWLAGKGRIENTGTLGDLNPGGVIPRDKYAGWLVPMSLRTTVSNVTVFGDASVVLKDMDTCCFDFVVLDAMKDYESRFQMFELVSRRMHPGSYCIQDGYWVNSAFDDFCTEKQFAAWKVGRIGIFANRTLA